MYLMYAYALCERARVRACMCACMRVCLRVLVYVRVAVCMDRLHACARAYSPCMSIFMK